jgi:ligand-binding sensor domain-containing protein
MTHLLLRFFRKKSSKTAGRARLNIGVILIGLQFLVQSGVSQSQYHFQRYSVKDGLANDFNWNIEQDSLGFIWVFYYGGMSRFDGYNFKTYRHDPDDSLRSKLDFAPEWPMKDHYGNLWFQQHMNAGPFHILARHDRKTDSFIKYQIDLGGEWPKGAWPIYKSKIFEKDGSLVWIGTSNKGLFSYNIKTGETRNYLNLGADGKPRRPLAIGGLKDLGHSLLMATGFGLWIFDKTTKLYSRPKCNPADSAFLFQNPIHQFLENVYSKENFTWLRINKSLIKMDSAFSVVQKFELPNENGFHYAFDSEGVFWCSGDYNSNTGLIGTIPETVLS